MYSWGNDRIWAMPSKETDTQMRNNFSVHGGWDAGSAGCIDLTGQMDSFVGWFEKNKKDVTVVVKYPKLQNIK